MRKCVLLKSAVRWEPRRGGISRLVLCGVLVAMQVVLSRFAGVQISEGLRVSFESVPVFLAGLWLGPVCGMCVGAVSDILGTILSGYGAYFPLLTVTPMLVGGLTGLAAPWVRAGRPWRLIFVVLTVDAVTSLLFGTWALTLYYSIVVGRGMPFSVLFLTRIVSKPVTIAVDTVLVLLLDRAVYAKVVYPMLARGTNGKEAKK